MKKKFFMLLMVFLLALGIVACGGDDEVVDTEKPVISGTRNFVYTIGVDAAPNYTQGVTAFDNLDGNITSKITVNSSAVNLLVPGVYNVVYTVTDLSGNVQTATVTVTVRDLTAPVITGVVNKVYVITGGSEAINYLAGVTATDNVDGNLTSAIVVDSSAVDLETVGVYTVVYTVTDSSGNSTSVQAAVQVKLHADDADLIPPIITGTMNHTFTISVSSPIDFLAGVVAEDNEDGDVSDTLAVDTSAVNYTVPGVYPVVYTANDSYGNVRTVTVNVTVVLETVPPVIGGVRVLEYYIGDAAPNYRLGLTVTDNVSIIPVSAIVVDSSAVNLTVAGRYPVYFSVADEAGNIGTAQTEIVVSVNPIDLTPDLTATYRTFTSGTNNLNPYSETLATASELFAWVVDSLYAGDYDWAAARQILVDEGVTGLPAEIGFAEWYAADKTAGQLPYNRYPQMAADYPEAMDTEGLVWRIHLRDDLKFQDGTVIDANTFNYSWQQLLDPKLLNDRASNLYGTTDLPLKNAEGYFKQLTPDVDELGFTVYKVGAVVFARANSFSHTYTDGGEWDLYFAANGKYQNYFAEDWGGATGWILMDFDGYPFGRNAAGQALAPARDGVSYLDFEGNAIPKIGEVIDGVDTASVGRFPMLPAYMDEDQNRAVVGANGLPVGGEFTYEDATPVTWEQVGFKVIDALTFEITLSVGRTEWNVMGALTSGITGVVHPAAYEAGMNAGRTQTTYGTIDNPLVSYGPYNMTAWETDVLYFYTLNPNHYDASNYRITKIRYDVIGDQSIAVSEFKAGRLDIVGAGGVYFNEFKFNKNMKLSPATTFFRFAFNIQGSDAYELNPILVYPEFRQAFYFAIDRETFSSEVRAPSHPTFGFLGPVYLSTEYNFISYRGSQPGQDVLADLNPETFGYNPTKAKQLFDEAYAMAVAAGDIQQGEVVTVEYKFFSVETNFQVANWVKNTVETIFNDGEATPLFSLALAPVSSAALNQAWANGDFEMTFGGWQGLNFNAPSMLGQVYNTHFTFILEKGFDTKNAPVTVSLPNTKVALQTWIDDYLLLATPTETQTTQYNKWVAVLALFDGDSLTTTYHGLFSYAYGEFYNVKDINYDGKTDDFDRITAALEGVLLDQMIAIPLFTTVAATVYSTRVVFESNEFHAWMGWGGFKYMYIGKATV